MGRVHKNLALAPKVQGRSDRRPAAVFGQEGLVNDGAAHLHAPAIRGVRPRGVVFEGAMETERAGRGRLIGIRPRATRGRHFARAVPLFDQQRLIARHLRVVKPPMALIMLGEVVFADAIGVMNFKYDQVFRLYRRGIA